MTLILTGLGILLDVLQIIEVYLKFNPNHR